MPSPTYPVAPDTETRTQHLATCAPVQPGSNACMHACMHAHLHSLLMHFVLPDECTMDSRISQIPCSNPCASLRHVHLPALESPRKKKNDKKNCSAFRGLPLSLLLEAAYSPNDPVLDMQLESAPLPELWCIASTAVRAARRSAVSIVQFDRQIDGGIGTCKT